MTIRLSEIYSSGTFSVQQVEDHGEESIRLKRLGVCEHRRLEVLHVGDPMIVSVVGSRIGISRRLAAHVTVTEPISAEVTETAVGAA